VNFTIQSQQLNQEIDWPELAFEHITMANGLPENSVLCILQDHLGYLWFGTQVGLVKYDGYTMKDYQMNPYDSLSISWGMIKTLYEDKSGDLWIGTFSKGLNRFNRTTETFTRFKHNPNDANSINSDSINFIFEDNNRNLLIGTNNGLNLFDRQNESFKYIYYNNSVYADTVSAIIEDRLTGNIYVGSNNEILLFAKDKHVLLDDIRINKLISNIGSINSFLQTKDGSIWIAHSMGLSKLELQSNDINLYQLIPSASYKEQNYFNRLTEGNNGLIWLTSGIDENATLVSFDPLNKNFKIYKHDPGKPHSISSSNNIWSIYSDRTGILWVGTLYTGLNKCDRNKSKFKRFVYDPDKPADGNFNTVFCIIEAAERTFWFGTNNGLNSFDRNSGEFRNYKYDIKGKNNTVTYIHKDLAGIFWLGTTTRGLVRFDPVGNTYFFYSNDPNDKASISHNTIRYILPDGKDILWVGTRGGGLNKFDKRTEDFIRYLPDAEKPQSLSNERVECILRDRKGSLWVGTQGLAGLNRFDESGNSFNSFSFFGGGPVVLTFYEDKKGNFWVGTFNRGISLFNRNKETFISNYNLANNLVRSILEDDSGNLWIGTDYGLSKLDPETGIIKNYTIYDNFEADRFSANSAFKTSTGEMLFGTYDGFIIFHPDSIKDDPTPPQVVITNVSLFNRPGEELEYEGFISELKELDLSYNLSDLRFDFVGLHFSEPAKNKYKYMLENFDKDWVDAGTQRNAVYTNLDPGEYVFKVKAANCDGIWNDEGKSIKLIIRPPYWATWWAYIIYFLFGISILYAVRRYEMNRLGLKNQVKLNEAVLQEREETDKMKSRFFANISHEFRTPLTLILGPADNIKPESPADEIQKQTGLIKRNAQRLMNLINQLLDLSKLEAGKLKIKASRNNIVTFVRGIAMSFESLAERKDITLKVLSERDSLEIYFDKDMMVKILTNLLSNAFKFTPEGGSITVSVNQESNEKIKIIVKDSGIGIPEAELPKLFDRFYQVDSSQTREYEGSGLGLALTKELVELHHGNIFVKSKIGEGSEFIIELPSGNDHLEKDEIVEPDVSDIEDIFIDESVFKKKTELITDDLGKDLREEKKLILLVEDNKDVREYIKDTLYSNYRVEEVSNGEQALNKAKEIMPDLIISDIMMPEMDGIEFCRIIKTEFLTSHIPVILLTAKASHENKIEGLETGADDYLTKPFDSKELFVRINNLIEQRKRLKEKFSKDFHPRPERVTTNPLDDEFLKKAYDTIEKHLDDVTFDTELLSKELFVSRMQLHRKIHAITGQAPGEFIRTYRLKRAAEMLLEKKLSVTQIAYEIGYNSPSHFSKAFTKYFNISPSEYIK
jgi:signal transduction histidine kinase/ligand-binding sensor domain-containing protein/DNA-binding response OmpR family regulator